jgi:hypothetical protein
LLTINIYKERFSAFSVRNNANDIFVVIFHKSVTGCDWVKIVLRFEIDTRFCRKKSANVKCKPNSKTQCRRQALFDISFFAGFQRRRFFAFAKHAPRTAFVLAIEPRAAGKTSALAIFVFL